MNKIAFCKKQKNIYNTCLSFNPLFPQHFERKENICLTVPCIGEGYSRPRPRSGSGSPGTSSPLFLRRDIYLEQCYHMSTKSYPFLYRVHTVYYKNYTRLVGHTILGGGYGQPWNQVAGEGEWCAIYILIKPMAILPPIAIIKLLPW